MAQGIIEENGNTKILKSILSLGTKHIIKLKKPDGNETTDKKEIIKIAEDFYKLLYTSQIPDNEIDRLNRTRPKVTNVGSEDIPSITVFEIKRALEQTKNRKAPGEDGVIIEQIKNGGDAILEILKILFNKCLEEAEIPEEWNNAMIVLLHKKGDRSNIANYRPVSLMSNLYKLFIRIIANRMNNKLDTYQPVEQAGFRKGFGTMDHLHSMKILIEKCNEYNINLALAFVDYEKAFDTIEMQPILKALDDCRIDTRYSNLLKNIYKNATSTIKLQEISQKIQIKRGVRQGDTLSPKLFTLGLENVFKKLNWTGMGINIDGKELTHLRYADDIVLIAKDETELTKMLEQLNEKSTQIGLKININKTKIMTNAPMPIHIAINGADIENVDSYIYLGHTLKLGKENQDAEIDRRIRLAWQAFGKLSFILKSRTFPIKLKAKIFDSCVLPVLAYGVETTTFTRKTINKLEVTERAMERRMLNITIRDRKRNEWIRQQTNVSDIIEKASRQKWNWAGHVVRMVDERWTNRITNWRPRQGKRSVGRPPKRWSDDIRAVTGRQWIRTARNRQEWKEKGEDYIQYWSEKV